MTRQSLASSKENIQCRVEEGNIRICVLSVRDRFLPNIKVLDFLFLGFILFSDMIVLVPFIKPRSREFSLSFFFF